MIVRLAYDKASTGPITHTGDSAPAIETVALRRALDALAREFGGQAVAGDGDVPAGDPRSGRCYEIPDAAGAAFTQSAKALHASIGPIGQLREAMIDIDINASRRDQLNAVVSEAGGRLVSPIMDDAKGIITVRIAVTGSRAVQQLTALASPLAAAVRIR